MNKKEINELERDIRYHNRLYREGNPIISDVAYDSMVEVLKEEDPENEIFKSGVIESSEGSRKQRLPYPMYSLNKEKSIQGVLDWCNKKNVSNGDILVITPKLDGISLQVNEFRGEAYTRGNGIEGQRSDGHYSSIESNPNDTITFGEVIVTKEKWKENFLGKINPKSGLKYKSSRNTVAGLFNQDEPAVELCLCNYIRYGIHDSKLNKLNQLCLLNSVNLVPIPMFCCNPTDLTEQLLDKLYKDWKVNLPIDGVVIDINDYQRREELGRESNNNPAYAIAYKHPKWAEDVESKVIGYKKQMSKQGFLKGTIQIDPIIIDGVEVTQATFYNAGYLTDVLPIIGCSIKVKRSGDVIPKITEIHGISLPARDEFNSDKEFKKSYDKAILKIEDFVPDRPKHEFLDSLMICPSCEEPLVWFNHDYVELICTNSKCKDVVISKLEHFFVTCGVEEFGRPTIETLYDNSYWNIEYILNMQPIDIIDIPGFGDSSAAIILNEFDRVFKKEGIPFARLLAALDLFKGKIGEKTIQLILDCITEDGVIDYTKLTPKHLNSINGVSDITANIFIEGLKEYSKMRKLDIKITYIESPKLTPVGDKCKDMKVCFTGVRDKHLEQVIVLNGGEIVSGVSKKTTLLIVDDMNTTSSKAVKAKELGIEIQTINDFKLTFKYAL